MRLVSLMAKNFSGACRDWAKALGWSYPSDSDWLTHRHHFRQGEAELAAVCGLVYVVEKEKGRNLSPVVAPVPIGEQYGGQAVYFSEVVVKSPSAYQDLLDLRGCRWACNESDSHSGCVAVGYELARRELPTDFFAEIVHSGGHRQSMEMVARGAVEAAAIDSTVLDYCRRHEPEFTEQLRSITRIGPSPHPLVVGLDEVPLEGLTQALEGLPPVLLRPHGYERLVAVTDSHYDSLREMLAASQPYLPYLRME